MLLVLPVLAQAQSTPATSASLAGKTGIVAVTQLVKNLESKKPQIVVVYGTSLTAGGAWVKQLREVFDKSYPDLVNLINSGMSGQWSGVGSGKSRCIRDQEETRHGFH